MRRREFIAGLGSAATLPLTAHAQQAGPAVIGYLSAGMPEATAYLAAAFRKGLSEAGYVDGKNVTIEYRSAYNDYSRLPELAADLVNRRVAVIATVAGTPAALAAKAATITIPIVFTTGSDPVQTGLVASLNRPGGNVTGIAAMTVETGAKRLELLRELVPNANRFAVLVNPGNQLTESIVATLRAAGASIGRQIEIVTASTNRDIDTAIAAVAQQRDTALLVSPDPFYDARRVQLITLAAHHAVPAIYPFRQFSEAGGLASYGPSFAEIARLAGVYTGRVLKGEKPTDLPVLQATKFEFVINLQTARILGLTVPPSLLATADEVIE